MSPLFNPIRQLLFPVRMFFVVCIALLIVVCIVVFGNRPQPALHETVTIEGSVGKLVGEVQRPSVKAGKVPTVIICHGLTGWRSENHLMAVNDSLLAHGYATVRFDFNGHGESEGEFKDMTLGKEIADLGRIYDYVAGLKWVDRRRIAVAGHSQGGFVAGVFAGDKGYPAVKCAVLLAPAACIYTMARDSSFFGLPIDIDNLPESLPFWGGRRLGRDYLLEAYSLNVYERTGAYNGPVLILQGTADDPGLIRDAAEYPKYLRDCKYVELEGLSHCYPENYALPARLTTAFIEEKL